MKIHLKPSCDRRRGMAIVAMVIATFSVVSVLSVMLTLASYSNDRANTERRSAEARYIGMGAVEAAKRELGMAAANWQPVPENGVVDVNGVQIAYEATETDPIPPRVDLAGIQTLVQGYEIFAVGESRTSRQPVRKLINIESMPLFQFAVFYNGDLEILPGPDMTINGRVHTNGNLYLGSGNTLSFDTNYVRAAGRILRHRKDDPSQSTGNVRIRRWVDNPFSAASPVQYVTMHNRAQMQALGVNTTSGYDSNFTTGIDANGNGTYFDAGDWPGWTPGALHFWGAAPVQPGDPPPDLPVSSGYTVLDQSHGTTQLSVPNMGSVAMFEANAAGNYAWDNLSQSYQQVAPGTGTHSKGFFHDQAGLSIIAKADGSWDAYNSLGVSIKAQVAGAVTVKQIYDARQAGGSGQLTRVIEVDVAALNASGAFPANGLLYSSHYGLGQGVNAKGIKLVNGSELSRSLTVASEGSVYVQGDFNTVNKKGAAVIGDAVNLLSNAWNDTKTAGNLPNASDTTFNLAIVSGNANTSPGSYNGGFENLPRFHENWTNRNCNIRGSFVNLSTSQYATGAWIHGGDRYTAPRRNWSYDPLFNNVGNLPPFTPMAVQVRDIAMW